MTMNGLIEIGESLSYYEEDELIYLITNETLNTNLLAMRLREIIEIDTNSDFKEFISSIHDEIMHYANRYGELYDAMIEITACSLPNMNTQFVNSDEYYMEYDRNNELLRVLISNNANRQIDMAFILDRGLFRLLKISKEYKGLTFDEIVDDVHVMGVLMECSYDFTITEEPFSEELLIEYIKKFIADNQALVAFPDFPIQQLKSSRK